MRRSLQHAGRGDLRQGDATAVPQDATGRAPQEPGQRAVEPLKIVVKRVEEDAVKILAESGDHLLPPAEHDADTGFFIPPIGDHLFVDVGVRLYDRVRPRSWERHRAGAGEWGWRGRGGADR